MFKVKKCYHKVSNSLKIIRKNKIIIKYSPHGVYLDFLGNRKNGLS